jgi:pimeloyl-ACP methyl ester carboxylesterase
MGIDPGIDRHYSFMALRAGAALRITATVVSMAAVLTPAPGMSETTNRTRGIQALSQPAALAAPVFEPYEYDYDGQHVRAELGRIWVPERHAAPGGRKIRLAFLRLRSTAPNPGPPIVYLAGGPGGSGVALAKGPRGSMFLRMREAGDVIALEQRGVGLSEPRLDCPGSLDFPLDRPGDMESLLKRFEHASRTCAEFWRERHVDLTAYNVVENAHDIDSLRRALGVRQVILWGSSYGTHLALAVLRHHGAGVLRAVLSGIEGPDHTLKMPRTVDEQFGAIARLIAADPALVRRVPDLTELVRRVLTAAEQTPFAIPVADTASVKETTVVLGRLDLEQAIVAMIGTRSDISTLPSTMLAFERRELSSPFVQQVAHDVIAMRTGSIGSAMAYAMDCSSSASKQRLAEIAHETKTATIGHLDFPIPDVCSAWDVPPLPPRERSLVRSAVPVLFLTGTLDARTPPRNAREVLRGFPNGYHVLIEGAGHGNDLFVSSPEIYNVTLQFIRTGKASLGRIDVPLLRFQ